MVPVVAEPDSHVVSETEATFDESDTDEEEDDSEEEDDEDRAARRHDRQSHAVPDPGRRTRRRGHVRRGHDVRRVRRREARLRGPGDEDEAPLP